MNNSRISPLAIYALLAAFASDMFLGDIDVGPVSPRVYIYLFLIAWMLFRIIVSGDALRLDGAGSMLLTLYAIFIVWCLFAKFHQGVSFRAMAVRFASYDFIAVAGFLLMLFVIRDRRSLKRFFAAFVVLIAVSSTVALAQATGLPSSWSVVTRLRPQFAAASGEPALFNGIFGPVPTFPPGLFATSFTFGYFLAATAVLALALFIERWNLTRLALVILIVASLFVVQQRSAVLAVALTCAVLFFAQFRRGRRRPLVIASVVVVLLSAGATGFILRSGSASPGRLRSFFDQGRVQVAVIAMQYIVAHPVVGGAYGYLDYSAESVDVTTKYEAVAPHNMFLNAAVFYGVPALFFLGLFLASLVLVMVDAWAAARRRYDVTGAAAVLSLVAYLINAQFHNASFVSGDPFPWWLIAMVMLFRRLPEPLPAAAPERRQRHARLGATDHRSAVSTG